MNENVTAFPKDRVSPAVAHTDTPSIIILPTVKTERSIAAPPARKRSKKPYVEPSAEELRMEADLIEAYYGTGPYSTYLKKRGRQPTPEEACGIGLLMGWRVKARDGVMYPIKTDAEKQFDREVKQRRKEYRRLLDHVFRLRQALMLLGHNEDDPAQAVSYINDHAYFGDPTIVDANLDKSLDWLQRFAAAWHNGPGPRAV